MNPDSIDKCVLIMSILSGILIGISISFMFYGYILNGIFMIGMAILAIFNVALLIEYQNKYIIKRLIK